MPCRCSHPCCSAAICMQDSAANLVWRLISSACTAPSCHSAVNNTQQLQAGTETRQERENKQAEMEALGADPEIYDKLTSSVAPSIWQMDDVKKGILCQLFGGSSKVRTPHHELHKWAGTAWKGGKVSTDGSADLLSSGSRFPEHASKGLLCLRCADRSVCLPLGFRYSQLVWD